MKDRVKPNDHVHIALGVDIGVDAVRALQKDLEALIGILIIRRF
jgi:hypothetical protein